MKRVISKIIWSFLPAAAAWDIVNGIQHHNTADFIASGVAVLAAVLVAPFAWNKTR